MIKYCDIYRDTLGSITTLGKMYLDSIYHCETLEDKVRTYGEKVQGETAIPTNVEGYTMTTRYSNRFKKELPAIFSYILNGQYIVSKDEVEFNGILCHGGNTVTDTEGCILCAKTRVDVKTIQGCADVVNKLIMWIKEMERLGHIVKCRVYNKSKNG